ncbi:MAG: efflux RND transporter permease subunit, partial [Reyranella sp.]|nr:efflux RND transporter permease subunit [Reyranella sp.]
VYDRTLLIDETVTTLTDSIGQETLITIVVMVLFLLHVRASIVIAITLPMAVLMSFIGMKVFQVDANIMSLAGLAIAIGEVGDMGIIVTESIYRHIAKGDQSKSLFQKVFEGASEVGGGIVTAVSNTLVSFIPVFFLIGQEGLLFRPLAFTKTFAIGASVVVALTVVPLVCYLVYRPVSLPRRTVWMIAAALGVAAMFAVHGIVMMAVAGGRYSGWPMSAVIGVIVALAFVRIAQERFLPLEQNPVARGIAAVYVPILTWVLAHKKTFLILPVAISFSGLTVWLGLEKTLAPLGWAINQFASEPASPELKQAMHLKTTEPVTRPLVEFGRLRWQRVKHADGATSQRIQWRQPDPRESDAEAARGIEVVQERGILPGIGREFIPPLDEGAFLYMPTLLPQAGLGPALEVNSRQDMAIETVPEVASVVGKLGRADTALDPAAIGMIESIIVLKPESEWRQIPVKRWFSDWPGWLKAGLAWVWPEHRRITKSEILGELQEKTAISGVLPTFLQPIQTRLVMLTTGFRAMMGVKIFGSDLRQIERIGLQIEQLLKEVPGAADIVADRLVGKPYLEFEIDRDRMARYGVNIRDVQDIIEIAIGGTNIMESVEGRERYPIRVRYLREYREDVPELGRILVPTSSGAHIPLAQVVTIRSVLGPQDIKGERGLLVGYVTMNTRDRDEVSVVEDAEVALQAAVQDGRLRLPPGYYWEWSGQFENQVRA